MAFNPNEMIGAFSGSGGYARNAHYYAYFASNPVLRFSISSINLPGRSIITDTFQFAPELPLARPITTAYSPVSFTAILDGNGAVLQYFRQQLDKVVTVQDQTFKVNYPESYESDMIIDTYRTDGQTNGRITLKQAYILQLGDVQLSWADDGISTVSVAMQYRTWSTE